MTEISEKVQKADKSQTGVCALDTFKSTTSVQMAQNLRRVQQLKESLKSLPNISYLTKSVHA